MNRELPEVADVDAALSRAVEWLSNPPIRVVEPGASAHGATLHGLDRRGKQPMGVYTEITGYAVSLFSFLAHRRSDRRFLIPATEAAEYLLRIQTKEGAYPDVPDPANLELPRRLFSFDTAMCIVGMARLAQATEEKRYKESAIAAGSWLLGMRRPDGSFHAMTEPGRRRRNAGGFFGDGGCLHAKNAIALLELHSMSGEREFLDAALGACDATVKLQSSDGAFWSTPERAEVYTHAHCYACEGLLYAGTVLEESRFLTAARRGIDWLAGSQRADGGWLAGHKRSGWSRRRIGEALRRPEPSDAAAQASRLFRLLGGAYEEPRRAALQFLLGCLTPGGGVAYADSRLGHSPLLYTWCTQFTVQALAWDSGTASVIDLF